jgi:hypothetical protein
MSQPHAIRLVGGTLLVHDDNDNVEALANTDILIKSGKIVEIGMNIRPTQTRRLSIAMARLYRQDLLTRITMFGRRS